MPTPQERAAAIKAGTEKARRDFLAYTVDQEKTIYDLLQQSADRIAARIEKAEKDGKIPAPRLRPLLDNIKAEMATLRPKIKGQIVKGMKNSIDYGIKAAVQGMVDAELSGGIKVGVGTSFVGKDGTVRRYDAQEETYQDSRWGKINKNALDSLFKFPEGLITISDRVWDMTWSVEKIVRNIIQKAIIQGDSAARVSRDIRGFLAQPLTLRGKAKEAYHPGVGTYKSAYQNAMRLARTEYNRAFNEGLYRYAAEKDWITGYIWHVGGSNPCEDCEALDGTPYDKGEEPDIPLHPNCMCYLELVTDETRGAKTEST